MRRRFVGAACIPGGGGVGGAFCECAWAAPERLNARHTIPISKEGLKRSSVPKLTNYVAALLTATRGCRDLNAVLDAADTEPAGAAPYRQERPAEPKSGRASSGTLESSASLPARLATPIAPATAAEKAAPRPPPPPRRPPRAQP